jgi:hypothetical protein
VIFGDVESEFAGDDFRSLPHECRCDSAGFEPVRGGALATDRKRERKAGKCRDGVDKGHHGRAKESDPDHELPHPLNVSRRASVVKCVIVDTFRSLELLNKNCVNIHCKLTIFCYPPPLGVNL